MPQRTLNGRGNFSCNKKAVSFAETAFYMFRTKRALMHSTQKRDERQYEAESERKAAMTRKIADCAA